VARINGWSSTINALLIKTPDRTKYADTSHGTQPPVRIDSSDERYYPSDRQQAGAWSLPLKITTNT
jgi:hypothetical protein